MTGQPQTPLIVLPCLGETAGMQQGDGTVDAVLRILRCPRHRFIMRGHSLLEPSLDLQHHAEIRPAGRRTRIKRDKAAEMFHRHTEFAELGPSEAENFLARRVAARIDNLDGTRRIAPRQQVTGERAPEPSILRRKRERSPVLRARPRPLPPSLQKLGQIAARMSMIGPGPRDTIEQNRRRIDLAPRATRQPQQTRRVDLGGIFRKQRRAHTDRLGKTPGLDRRQRRAQGRPRGLCPLGTPAKG